MLKFNTDGLMRLQKMCKERGWGASALASDLNDRFPRSDGRAAVDTSAVQRWLYGESRPSLLWVTRLRTAYGFPDEAWLTEEERGHGANGEEPAA
jgi:hypothetical protein